MSHGVRDTREFDALEHGTLIPHRTTLRGIAKDKDLINFSPEECQELVHLLVALYTEERNPVPADFMVNKAHKSYIKAKEAREGDNTNLNVLLLGLVRVPASRNVLDVSSHNCSVRC